MNIISSLGLILDIIGVLYLFQYGLPSKINEGTSIAISQENPEQIKIDKENAKIKRRAYIGLAFVLLGFILQFIGTNLPFFCQMMKCGEQSQ